jgi:NAD+ synthase
MLAELQLNAARERQRIVAFIRKQTEATGLAHLVLGLSGGVDSALAAALCAEAVGPQRVHAYILPYATSNPESEAHARLVISALGLPWERFEITPMVQPLLERYPNMDERRKGNIMARCRMLILYDASAAWNGLVVGTSNRTETLLGYFTLHGDGAAAFKPIAHLYKCQIRQLARHVGVPEAIVAKAPSADLWKGQTDEGELGFTYDEADQVLYLLTECGQSVEAIVARGFERGVVEAIARRMQATAYKRAWPPTLEPQNPLIR